jgi:hypothetical protein
MAWSNIDLKDCHPGYQAMFLEFCILSSFHHITCGKSFTTGCVPVGGSLLGAGTGSDTSVVSCSFYDTVWEGVNGAGIDCVNAFITSFIGGTSESNVRGVDVAAICYGLTFERMFCEANSDSDFVIAGKQTHLKNCQGTSPNSLLITGHQTVVEGGLYDTINSTTGEHSVFDGVTYMSDFQPNEDTDKWRNIRSYGGGTYIDDNWT